MKKKMNKWRRHFSGVNVIEQSDDEGCALMLFAFSLKSMQARVFFSSH